MAKITNTEAPEDFALHLLDQLMEREGDKLTTFQVIQAAQAYATAGMAQATRESNVGLDSLTADNDNAVRRYVEENEGRAIRLGGELPVIEFVPNGGIPSPMYELKSNGTETYWVHRNATEEERDAGIELLRFFSNTEETTDLHTKDESGGVPFSQFDRESRRREEADKKDRLERLGTSAPVLRDTGKDSRPGIEYYTIISEGAHYWAHDLATQTEIKDGIKALKALSEEENALEHVDVSGMDIDAAYAEFKKDRNEGNIPAAKHKVLFKEDIYEKEPTKVLPQTLREKIEAEIAARKDTADA